MKQPSQQAAALCAKCSFNYVYKESKEDDASKQIVQEVQPSSAGGEDSQLKTSCTDTQIHAHQQHTHNRHTQMTKTQAHGQQNGDRHTQLVGPLAQSIHTW